MADLNSIISSDLRTSENLGIRLKTTKSNICNAAGRIPNNSFSWLKICKILKNPWSFRLKLSEPGRQGSGTKKY